MTWEDDLDNIEFDFGLPSEQAGTLPGPGRAKTSDALSKNARKFLTDNDIREGIFNKPSFKILQNVLVDLRLPKRGEQIRIRTQQQINLIAMVLKILEVHKVIDELTVATYTLNRLSIEAMMDAARSGAIKCVNLLISSSYSFRDKTYFQELKDFALGMAAGGHNFHLTFAWSHFKITLARCGKDHYQFEGSMNYSTNNMAEQLVFENNKITYDYDYDFITQVMIDKKNKALDVIC